MKIKEIMITSVKAVGEDSTAAEAALIMGQNNIGSLVVVRGKVPVGLITERDVLNSISKILGSSGKIRVSEIMTRNPIMVGPDNDVDLAIKIMAEKGVKKLPVVKDGELKGIVTDTDIMKSVRGLDSLLSIFIEEAEKAIGKDGATGIFRRAYESLSPEERRTIKGVLTPKMLDIVGVAQS